jgi:hypothetical protein
MVASTRSAKVAMIQSIGSLTDNAWSSGDGHVGEAG